MSLVATLLSWVGCFTFLVQALPFGDETRRVAQVVPPPPAPVPPNASCITATVRKQSVWPPGSLQNTTPPVPPNRTLYSLTLEIHTSDPENAGLDSLARPGGVIETFSSDVLASDVVGKKIKATLKLTGDTRGVRWQIANVHVLP